MALQSIDNIISSMSSGKIMRTEWNKITGGSAYTAGRSYDFSILNGSPIANAYAGTALNWVTCTESTGNGTQIFGIRHGGDVSANIKHLLNMSSLSTAATSVPGTLILMDLQGYFPGISANTLSAQTLVGTPTLRYANGVGVRPYLVTTTITGATAHNITLSYTNTASTAGRALGATVAATASSIVGHITHAGIAANNYGPYLPLASGDVGVKSVQTITLSAASGAGVFALCLGRELARLSLGVSGLTTEKDLLNQIPSLPVIVDGACLVWLYIAGAATAANTTFIGANEFVWG